MLRLASSAVQAFDGSAQTKWLDFGASGGKTTWLTYAVAASRQPVQLAGYSMTSANDSPERDPGDWVLEGRPCTGTGVVPRVSSCCCPGLHLADLRPVACAQRLHPMLQAHGKSWTGRQVSDLSSATAAMSLRSARRPSPPAGAGGSVCCWHQVPAAALPEPA